MKNLAYDILGGLLLLVIGFLIGWHAKGVSVKAGELKGERAESAAIVTGVNKQAAAQHADLVVEQGKSVALATNMSWLHRAGDHLQAEIDHAAFTPAPAKPVHGQQPAALICPDDPVGSDDFVRLYNAAAEGADPAAAGTAAAR